MFYVLCTTMRSFLFFILFFHFLFDVLLFSTVTSIETHTAVLSLQLSARVSFYNLSKWLNNRQ